MQALSALLSWSLAAHACTMALEGILLAQRELTYLASCYAVNTLLILLSLAMLGGRAIAISSVWGCLLAFQVSHAYSTGGYPQRPDVVSCVAWPADGAAEPVRRQADAEARAASTGLEVGEEKGGAGQGGGGGAANSSRNPAAGWPIVEGQ